jgi:predicted acyl esterase
MVTMSDGVRIATTLYRPAGPPERSTGWPAVMLFHGLGGTRSSFNAVAEQYLANRYVVLSFDARAHGESGGLFDLDGPREIADVRELFEWLAAQPGVDRTKIGAFGASYGGGAIWKATADGIPFAAIVPAITWTDLYTALAPQDLPKTGLIYALSQLVPVSRYSPQARALLADALLGRNLGALKAYVRARSTRSALGRIRVPTFMLQGRRDFLFDADQALAAFRALRGPKRLYLGDFGHLPSSFPGPDGSHMLEEARAWFDRFLYAQPNGIDMRPPLEIAADLWTGKTRELRQPPATRAVSFVLGGRRSISAAGSVVRTVTVRRAVETFGAPVVRVTASSRTRWGHLVAVLTARTPAGKEIVVSEGGTATGSLRRRPTTISIRLMNEITAIPAGSRLELMLAGTSSARTASSAVHLLYLVPVAPLSRLTVGTVRLTLPTLRSRVSP